MSHFETNLQFLRQRDPELVRRLEDLEREKGLLLPISDERGHPNIQLTDKDGAPKWLYENVARSQRELQEALQGLTKQTTLILLGLGLGYHLETIVHNPPRAMRFLIVMEPSLDLFSSFLAVADRRTILGGERIKWMVGMSELEMESFLRTEVTSPEFASCTMHDALISWEYRSSHFDSFQQKWNAQKENLATRIYFNFIDSYYGFMNFMDNWGQIADTPHLPDLAGLFDGKPGILVGSGPSLTLSLDWLRQIQDKAVIFAAGSALPILQKNGIRFFLTSALERPPNMKGTFEGFDTENVTLVTTPIIHRELLEIYQGPVMYLGRSHHFLPAVFPEGQYDNLYMTTVSHVGLQALSVMGCRPIYLVGQDLALDPVSRETHAKDYVNSLPFEKMLEFVNKTRRVRSNKGPDDFIETWAAWWEYGETITQMIRSLHIECYNAIPREYGIHIEEAPRIDPDEAFRRVSQGDDLSVKNELDVAYRKAVESRTGRIRQDIKNFPERAIRSLQHVIDECSRISEEIHDYSLVHPEPPSSPEQVQAFKAFMKRIEEESEKITQEPLFHGLIFPIVSSRFYECMVESYFLLDQDEADSEVYVQKLALPLSWHSEMIVRSSLALRRFMGIVGKEGRCHESFPT